jgi:O-antigen/teichoic acid export membrane protein
LEPTKTLVGEHTRRGASWDLLHGPRNYVSLVSAQLASAVLSFAAVWLATHLLGSSGYGGVVAIVAASQAIGQLAVNWTSVSLWRCGLEEFVTTGRISKAFWTRFWIFLPNVLLVLATSPLWLPFLSSVLELPPQAYPYVLGHFLANALWVHVQQGLQGAKLMRLQGGLLTFERSLVLLIILGCAVTGNASFLVVAVAYIVGPLGASIVGLRRLRQLILPVEGIDRTLLKRMLTFSLPALPASLVGYMSSNYLDAFFITHYLSRAELGVYAVAYQITGIGLQLPLLVGSVLLPLFVTLQAEGQLVRAERFMFHALPLLTLMWGIACASAAATGAYFFPLIFGEQFRGVGALLWPLMAAAALAGPALMGYAPFSNSKFVTYIAMIAAIASGAANIMLNYLLMPTFGLIGCAWATTAAYGVSTLTVVMLVHWRLLPGRSWTIQAALPVVAGSILATYYSVNLIALTATLFLSAVLMLLHRKSVTVGFRMLKNFQRGGSVTQSLAES